MANTRTLSQLRDAVAVRGSYENSQDITTAILTELVNEAIAETYDILIGKWADYYTILSNDLAVLGTVTGTGDSLAVASGVVTLTDAGASFKAAQVGQRITLANNFNPLNSGTFTIVSVPSATTLTYRNDSAAAVTEAFTWSIDGASSVQLPTDFYKLRKVEIRVSDTRWRRLYPHDLDVAHVITSPVRGRGYRYRLQASKLELVPTPATAEVVRIYYIPFAPRLSADSDTFDGINNYEELVIQIAFRRCREREELDTSQIEREIDRLMARVRTNADARDAGQPFYLDPYGPDDVESEDWWE